MREIKFRAWDKKQKEMIFSGVDFHIRLLQMTDEYKGERESIIGFQNEFEGQLFEMMQFTGLHDKNGKEIYEGDIILHDEIRFEVIWSNGRFLLRHERKWLDDERNIWNIGESGMEVIGNRFENPELLKEVK